MKVINVAGFDVKFEKDERMYHVPNDGNLHSIPDKCFYEDNFYGLLRVIIPPKPVQKVVKETHIDINEPENKQEVIDKSKPKPLKGKKLKSTVRKKLHRTRPTGKKKKE